MSTSSKDLLQIASYYSEKIRKFGTTACGVDWNGEHGQSLRFEQLCKVLPIDPNSTFSVNDLGCGYGALNQYLHDIYKTVTYTGYDISQEMILAARDYPVSSPNKPAIYICENEIKTPADFGIASGIFNVKLEQSNAQWLDYIKKTLHHLDETSLAGFSFNCLTSYSDPGKMRTYLYYANPCEIFDFCKSQFSRNVALLHDYELYEFTIIVRK